MRNRRLGLRAAFVLAVALDLFLRPGTIAEKALGIRAPEPALTFDYVPAVLLGASQQASLAAAFTAQDALNQSVLDIEGVVGTAVGLGPTGQAVVKVYLETPGIAGIPMSLTGIPIVQEVLGKVWALGQNPAESASDSPLDPKTRFPRPVPIGVSAGQPDVTAGTIGARATDGSKIFALSNNHVFANSNNAKIGDNVLQPGRVDGGADPDHSIATLHDFEAIKFCTALYCPNNELDAAIALTTAENLGTSTPENGYGKPLSTTAKATLNMKVQKYGRTTGHTHGSVTGIRATINVNYRNGQARFVNQIVVTGQGAFSKGGDSGSLIVTEASDDKDRQPVALLFAGSNMSTIANPIDPVLKRFGITIDGS